MKFLPSGGLEHHPGQKIRLPDALCPHVVFLCAIVVMAVVIVPSSAAPVPDACNVPVIKDLTGPDVIYYDDQGQVGETYTFSAVVEGGTPPYTYQWRFGGGRQNEVVGTGSQYARLSHVISDKWVVVSLRVTDSEGKSASWQHPGWDYQGTNATLAFTLGWDDKETSPDSPSAPGNMAGILSGPSSDDGTGAAYISKVPTYPYQIPGCPSGIASPTDPGTASPDESGIPWLPIVGGIAAVAIAAAALAKGLAKKKPEDRDKKDEGPAGYILQISPTDTIKVSTKESGSFTVTAWKVDENGSISRANNATITLLPPPQVPELSVAPASGMGSISVNVSLGKPATVPGAKIQIDASAGGKGTSAFVTVNFGAETTIEFE